VVKPGLLARILLTALGLLATVLVYKMQEFWVAMLAAKACAARERLGSSDALPKRVMLLSLDSTRASDLAWSATGAGRTPRVLSADTKPRTAYGVLEPLGFQESAPSRAGKHHSPPAGLPVLAGKALTALGYLAKDITEGSFVVRMRN